MGYTENRIAEFKEELRKAPTDWEREHWQTRLDHAKRALEAEKAADPVEPLQIDAKDDVDDGKPKRSSRSAR